MKYTSAALHSTFVCFHLCKRSLSGLNWSHYCLVFPKRHPVRLMAPSVLPVFASCSEDFTSGSICLVFMTASVRSRHIFRLWSPFAEDASTSAFHCCTRLFTPVPQQSPPPRCTTDPREVIDSNASAASGCLICRSSRQPSHYFFFVVPLKSQ